MGMPAVRRHWSPEEVRELQGESRPWPRYELIGGELFVTPAPGASHQLMVTELARIVGNYLVAQPVGLVFVSPADLELETNGITQPDVFVVPRSGWVSATTPRWNSVRALSLAVEVISPSSARTDRVEKREVYVNSGTPDYWVVDIDARTVECWTTGRDTPQVVRSELVWSPTGCTEPLRVSLTDLFHRADPDRRWQDLR
jgi:Uma2 family endonuclease